MPPLLAKALPVIAARAIACSRDLKPSSATWTCGRTRATRRPQDVRHRAAQGATGMAARTSSRYCSGPRFETRLLSAFMARALQNVRL